MRFVVIAAVLLVLSDVRCLALCALPEPSSGCHQHGGGSRSPEPSHFRSCLHSHIAMPVRAAADLAPDAADIIVFTNADLAEAAWTSHQSSSHLDDLPPPLVRFEITVTVLRI
jgi:hypothetical protein